MVLVITAYSLSGNTFKVNFEDSNHYCPHILNLILLCQYVLIKGNIIFRHVSTSVDFFQQCTAAEEWMKGKEELLNTRFALSEFKLEEGENLLKEMQELRDELSNYEDEVQRLIEAAGEIVPLRARRERLRQPIDAVAICAYQSHEVSIM